MKRVLQKEFQLFMVEPADDLAEDQLKELEEKYRSQAGYAILAMPMQVHDVLIHHHVIEDPAITGSGEACLWVSEKDWVYVAEVEISEAEKASYETCYLQVGGVDTFADIYWNGVLAAHGENVHLPVEADLSGKCEKQNFLMIHVHSAMKIMEEMDMPERYAKIGMPKWAMFRGQSHNYSDYLGFKPYLAKMGVYDTVYLEYGAQGIRSLDLSVGLKENESGQTGCVEIEISCYQKPQEGEAVVLCCELKEGESVVDKRSISVTDIRQRMQLTAENPRLWNVIHKGEAFLYELTVRLKKDQKTVDQIERKIGFRKIEKVGDFDFRINGMPLKIWGANLAQIDHKSSCYQPERAARIVRQALDANMNCLRVWGPGDKLPDEFYTMCDEAGLLLWQDFYHDCCMYPEEEAFRAQCRAEAEFQVKRLRYHPSILLWCGSNESMMCGEFSDPVRECTGYPIYDEDYRRICGKLDPERFYHVSSPSGGAFANDPLKGDTHSYTSTWFVPGGKYPVFLSENMRAYPPVYHSMLRMVGKEKIWPEGENGQMCKGTIFPWPKSWEPYTSAESWTKISPVEQFYDANDAESMIYRFGGSVGRYIEECVGRYRRGRSYEERNENYRRCKGHLWWKMNTSSPHIYSGLTDYYLETYIPYYAMKRSYQPFQMFFSVDDFIGLWAVNDTLEEKRGTVSVKLFHMERNEVAAHFELPFCVMPDQSLFVTDLNRFGQFLMNKHVLYAKAVDENGNVLTEVIDRADIEHHMEFPDCRLTLSWDGDELIVETDRYARSIELLGEEEGDYFGWQFEDNYFDLLPGMVKRLHVSGNHEKGRIYAKGYYAKRGSVIDYKREKAE